MIRKVIRLNYGDIVVSCGIVAGVFLLTHLVTAGVMIFLRPISSVMISALMLPICAGVMVFIISLTSVLIAFPMAIQLGQTRRHALGQILGHMGFNGLCCMALAVVLSWAEPLFSPALWRFLSGAQTVVVATEGRSIPAPPSGVSIFEINPSLLGELWIVDFGDVLPWWGWVLILLGAVAAGLIVGAVVLRFGQKGLWVLYIAAFAPSMILPHLPWAEHWFSFDWLFPTLAVLAVAALVWSIWSMLHTVIKA